MYVTWNCTCRWAKRMFIQPIKPEIRKHLSVWRADGGVMGDIFWAVAGDDSETLICNFILGIGRCEIEKGVSAIQSIHPASV